MNPARKSVKILAGVMVFGLLSLLAYQWHLNSKLKAELDELRRQTQRGLTVSGQLQVSLGNDDNSPVPTRDAISESPAPPVQEGWRAVSWERTSDPPDDLAQLPLQEADVENFLRLPVEEQARSLAWFRLRGGPEFLAAEERIELRRVVKEDLRPRLEALESTPDQIANFQSTFVAEMLGLENPDLLGELEAIIRNVYEHANTDGVDSLSRPEDENLQEAWASQRDALDREATRAVQELLPTDFERTIFNRNFIGIMGIDLGVGDGTWHRVMEGDSTIVFPSEGE